MKTKSKRPISRKFWSLLRFIPGPIRKEFIRSKFELSNDLPENIVFKQAETADEIFQSMNLVYESFVDLGYIDKNSTKMRFNKYLALPNTVILIAKQNEVVLGTISIIPDSSFGLPTDATWPISKIRKSGKIIAEISSLAIHKDFKLRRGKLLFYICKIMYQYCKQYLNLDGIVIATTLEVEPFYTDILMFEKVVKATGQKHSLVKGNPSTCCYLDLNRAESDYKETYGNRADRQNLYKFFVEMKDSRIRLPDQKLSVQGYTKEKNLAQKELFRRHKELHDDFTDEEKQVLWYSDHYKLFSDAFDLDARINLQKVAIRSDIRATGWLFSVQLKEPLKCKILDVSECGFKLASASDLNELTLHSKISVAIQIDSATILCRSEVIWITDNHTLGARIINPPHDWIHTIQKIEAEVFGPESKTQNNNRTIRQAS